MKTFKELLIELRACGEVRTWAADKTIEEVIRDSQRGDWLLWLAKKIDIPLIPLTLAKARCAKTVIHLMKDERSYNAVNVAERFGLGECTLEELNNAAYAAYAAYDSYGAYGAYDCYASSAAAAYYAAASYDSAAWAAASYASYASYAAVTTTTTYAAARKQNQQQTSDICVEILGEMIVFRVNELLK